MKAADFAKRSEGGFAYGVAGREAAAALRRFANDIDAGRVVVVGATTVERAKNDDFVDESLILRYHLRTEGR